MKKLKFTGLLMGALASAVLVSKRNKLRRASKTGNFDSRADNAATPSRQPETRTDAGGQTA